MRVNQGSMARDRFHPSRRFQMAGHLSAMSLGDLQAVKRPLAAQVCKHHVWRISKWSRQCTRCGLVEDR
jgi:hypothetical protein